MIDEIPELTREEKIKKFGEGEWLDEPDYFEFEHKGICCEILRNLIGGYFCGYVKIPEDHILYREVNDENVREYFDVHGGITFNDIIDDEHYIGFDCAHSDDVVLAIEKFKKTHYQDIYKDHEELLEKLQLTKMFQPTYKNIEFVRKELMNLADQVLEYGK